MQTLRILMIARHYPPLVSGGARRPFLLASGLRELGYEVRVVAPVLPEGEPGLAVPHVAAGQDATEPGEPRGAERRSSSARDVLRTQVMVPDPDIRWALAACRAVRRAGWEPPDWIVTTSPPESVHVAGLLLARRTGARWVADLRDGWLHEPLMAVRQRALRRSLERPLARALLARADVVTTATAAIREEASRLGAQAPLILAQPSPPPASPPPSEHEGPLTILHTGSFSLSDGNRRIGPLLDLFRTAGPDARLRLVGRLTEEERAAARAVGAEVTPPVPMEAAWALQRDADVLVLVASEGTDAVPGKLAEYAASGRPVVCLGGGAWRAGVPGADRAAQDLLIELADPAARAALAQAQARLAVSPVDAARMLVSAMERAG